MTFLSSLFGSVPWEAIMALGAALFGLVAYRKGRGDEKRKQKVRNLENHIDTRRRADSAADHARTVGGTLSDDELNGRLRKHPGAIRE